MSREKPCALELGSTMVVGWLCFVFMPHTPTHTQHNTHARRSDPTPSLSRKTLTNTHTHAHTHRHTHAHTNTNTHAHTHTNGSLPFGN